MKFELCFCKKDFKQETRIYSQNKQTLLSGSSGETSHIAIFEKGKFYYFYFEKAFEEPLDSVWVMYNNGTDIFMQGLRFHNPKYKPPKETLNLFSEYFEYGRILKLRKIKEINEKLK